MKIPRRFRFIKYSKNRYEYTVDKNIIKIPSLLYPLNDSPELFYYENTEQIIDEDIIDIINSADYEIGRCYTNAENLTKLLKSNRNRAVIYVGWLIIQRQLPVHHSWVILNKKYLIDLSADYDALSSFIKNHSEDSPLADKRKEAVNFYKKALKWKHSERLSLGKVSPNAVYIGCPCSKNKGIEIFENLVKSYPNHPALINTNASGLTRIQQMMKISKGTD